MHTLGALTSQASEACSFELPPPHVHAAVMSIALTKHFLVSMSFQALSQTASTASQSGTSHSFPEVYHHIALAFVL